MICLIKNKAQPGDEEKYRKFVSLVTGEEIMKMQKGEMISDETALRVVEAVLKEDLELEERKLANQGYFRAGGVQLSIGYNF